MDWGSVPDWVQAIGAVIASIGLVYTLILQQKTLKEQQKITLIEQENFLRSHLPVLEISDVEYTKELQDRNVKFKITIRTNSLQNLKVTHNFPDNYKITIPHYVSDVILPSGYNFQFEITFTLESVFIEVVEYTGNTIIFDFQDVFGNDYRQLLIYKGSDLLFLHPAVRGKNLS